MKNTIKIMILCLMFSSCKEHQLCLDPGNVYPSPYENPSCNPNGKFVLFEHMPISTQSLVEGSNGCPSYYYYQYKEDSLGLWIIDSDGKNMRRIYSHRLGTCTWSPDGKKIAFAYGKLALMNFDGQNLDTVNIQLLNTSGLCYNPSWNKQGNEICYSQGVKNDTLISGIYIYNIDSKKSEFLLKLGNFPCWSLTSDSIFYIKDNSIYSYVIHTKDIKQVKAMDASYTNSYNLKTSPDGKFLFFNSFLTTSGETQLYRINIDGTGFTQLTQNGCEQFSVMPDGRLIYVNFKYNYIDDKSGTLWIMDYDGKNIHQLTYNTFKTQQLK